MTPKHQDTVPGIKAGSYLCLLQAPFVQFLEKHALAGESGVSDREATSDPTRRWRHQFVEQPTRALACVGPQLVKNRDHLIAAGGAGVIARIAMITAPSMVILLAVILASARSSGEHSMMR